MTDEQTEALVRALENIATTNKVAHQELMDAIHLPVVRWDFLTLVPGRVLLHGWNAAGRIGFRQVVYTKEHAAEIAASLMESASKAWPDEQPK